MRCAEPVREGASLAETRANLCSGRSGPAGMLLRRPVPARLVSPCRPREGADEGKGDGRFVTSHRRTRKRCSSWWVPVRRRIAEVGRASSGSEKRVTGSGRVESLLATTERVNGSLTMDGAQARKRRRPSKAKGGRFTLARRSSSRERRVRGESFVVSIALRRERDARGD